MIPPTTLVRLHLRQAREAKRWSQKELAHRAHIAQNTVYLFEKGHDTRLSSVLKIARALDVVYLPIME